MIYDGILEKDFIRISESDLIDWKSFDDSAFFITGITGLIGSMIARSLMYASEYNDIHLKIIGFVRDEEKAKTIFGNYIDRYKDHTELVFIEGDICDQFIIEEKVDYIIHCASPTSSKYFIERPVETIETMVIGTDNILKIAKERLSRSFVYVSSMEVYGQTIKNDHLITEKVLGYIDILSTRSSYSEGKRICECLCYSAANQYGLNICIGRLAQTFGAGVLKNENRVFAQFANSVLQEKDIVLHTDGLSEGNYVYSADAVLAILLLLQKGVSGEAYNICNEDSHSTVKNMAEMVANEIANGKINVVFDLTDIESKGYAPHVKMHLSSEKIRKLGWKPTVGLKEAFERMIESLRQQNGRE